MDSWTPFERFMAISYIILVPLTWEALINPAPHLRSLAGLPPPRWSIQRLVRWAEMRWWMRHAWPRKGGR